MFHTAAQLTMQFQFFQRRDEMNHDMQVATGININPGGVDTNAGMSGEKGMPGTEIGGINPEKSMRMNNGQNFATGADSGMEFGMGYGTWGMRGDQGMGYGSNMNDANTMNNGMGDGMGNGYGMGGNNMQGIDMRMYMGTIKRSKTNDRTR